MKSFNFQNFFLCEDWPSLECALSLKEKLRENCRHQAVIGADFCEYARLRHPRLRENASRKAIASDMIIVSAHGTAAFPGFVQNWMNELDAYGKNCLRGISQCKVFRRRQNISPVS